MGCAPLGPGFKSQLCHFLVVGLWGSCLTTPTLGFLTCKMRMKITTCHLMVRVKRDDAK